METIKKEKKADLEQLLNRLVKRGRVPFGDEKIHSFEIIYVTGKIRNIVAKRGRGQVNMHYSIIELCSKSSGLWQFVCENGMMNIEYDITKSYKDSKSRTKHGGYNGDRYLEGYDMYNYKYLLIESSLKDESELEQFLLDNIKVDVKGD